MNTEEYSGTIYVILLPGVSPFLYTQTFNSAEIEGSKEYTAFIVATPEESPLIVTELPDEFKETTVVSNVVKFIVPSISSPLALCKAPVTFFDSPSSISNEPSDSVIYEGLSISSTTLTLIVADTLLFDVLVSVITEEPTALPVMTNSDSEDETSMLALESDTVYPVSVVVVGR